MQLKSATTPLLPSVSPTCSCSISSVSSIESLSCLANDSSVVAGTGTLLFTDLEQACAQFLSFENGSWIFESDNLTLLNYSITSFNLRLTSSCENTTSPGTVSPTSEDRDFLLILLLVSCGTAGGAFIFIVILVLCCCLISRKCIKKSGKIKQK